MRYLNATYEYAAHNGIAIEIQILENAAAVWMPFVPEDTVERMRQETSMRKKRWRSLLAREKRQREKKKNLALQ